MKSLLIALTLITTGAVKAQSNTTRIADLEKWSTQVKGKLKADSIAIVFLKKGKTADSLRIKVLTDSFSKFKETYFMPPFFNVRPGIARDSVQFIPLQ